jgi:hypothetical protein
VVVGGAVSWADLMGAGVTSLQPCSRILTCYMTTYKFVVSMISTLYIFVFVYIILLIQYSCVKSVKRIRKR